MGKRKTKGFLSIVIGITAGFLLLGAGAAYAYLLNRPLRAVLFGLDAAEKEAIGLALAETKRPFVLTERPAGTLAAALAAPLPPDLVFARSGLELSRVQGELERLPDALLRRVPQSLAWAVAGRDGTRALPLLADHFEIAWRFEPWERLRFAAPREGADLERAAAALKSPKSPAILFAGGDAETCLLVLSALCAARGGAAGYRSAVDAAADWGRRARAEPGSPPPVEPLLAPGAPLGDAVAELRRWSAAGLLHPEWRRLSGRDVRSFMESGLGSIVLQTLSFHRTVPYRAISEYRSAPFPRYARAERPALVAPLTVVAVPRRGLRAGKAAALAAELAAPVAGYLLAEKSGRASAIAAARAPDVQAADALAWAAAHRVVVSGLYRDAFAEPETAEAFAAAVREAAVR